MVRAARSGFGTLGSDGLASGFGTLGSSEVTRGLDMSLLRLGRVELKMSASWSRAFVCASPMGWKGAAGCGFRRA